MKLCNNAFEIFGVISVLLIFAGLTESTICKPSSTFKLDCYSCQCSQDGRQYSCPQMLERCPPRNKEDFIEEYNDKGYLILKPRQQKFDPDDNSYVLTRKIRELVAPSLNDLTSNNNVDDSVEDREDENSKPEIIHEYEITDDSDLD